MSQSGGREGSARDVPSSSPPSHPIPSPLALLTISPALPGVGGSWTFVASSRWSLGDVVAVYCEAREAERRRSGLVKGFDAVREEEEGKMEGIEGMRRWPVLRRGRPPFGPRGDERE